MNHADTIINCTFAKQCNAQVCCVCASVRLRFHTMFVVGQTKLEGVKGLILFKVMYGTSECCSRPWADPLLLAAAAWMGKRCSESILDKACVGCNYFATHDYSQNRLP